MKRIRKFLGIMLFAVCVSGTVTWGAEVTVTPISLLMTAAGYVEAKSVPDEGAEIVITYDAGASVYVIGETSGGWYQVSYQDKVGYVKKETLKAIDVDLTALAKEMGNEETAGKIVVEEVERTRNEEERSSSWIVALAIIIGGMFITGILIASVSPKRRRRRRRKKR